MVEFPADTKSGLRTGCITSFLEKGPSGKCIKFKRMDTRSLRQIEVIATMDQSLTSLVISSDENIYDVVVVAGCWILHRILHN